MYKFFLECFQKYLSLYSAEFAADERLLTLLVPLYGLTNGTTYDNWKLSSDLRYYEASNLVYRMLHDEGLPGELRELGAALLVNGRDAVLAGPGTFAEETVQGQLKLIYAMLTRDPLQDTSREETAAETAEEPAEPAAEDAAEEPTAEFAAGSADKTTDSAVEPEDAAGNAYSEEDDAVELDMEGTDHRE